MAEIKSKNTELNLDFGERIRFMKNPKRKIQLAKNSI